MTAITGGCLCGAVRLTATLPSDGVLACHCTQCQRWTGGGPLYSINVADLELTGTEAIAAYHASDWGERAFCKTCGSTLYWRMQGRDIAMVAPGLLDDQSGLTRVKEEIFVDHRPDWLPAQDGANQSTEADQKAKLEAYLAKGET